eukprot:gene10338-21568_t
MQAAPDLGSHFARGVVSSCRVLVAPKPRRMVSISTICNSTGMYASQGEFSSDSIVNKYEWPQNQTVLPSFPMSNCLMSSSPLPSTINPYLAPALRPDNPEPANIEAVYDVQIYQQFQCKNNIDISRVSLQRVSCSI